MVSGKKVQEGLSVLGPEFQLLNISGKSLAGATKTTDKGKEYQEGDICVIICVDHVGNCSSPCLRNFPFLWGDCGSKSLPF